MINHARSLLINLDGSTTGFAGGAGEEFIPPDYRAVGNLPSFAVQIRNVLFGSAPDRLMLNYRVRQLMGMLHVTELEEFVLALDPRITYKLLPLDELFESQFISSVKKLAGTTGDLSLLGEIGPPNSGGKTSHQWRVQVLDSNSVLVVRLTPPISSVSQTYEITEGLSDIHELPGSSLSFRFAAGVGQRWLVDAVTRPEEDLSDLLGKIQSLTDNVFSSLFGVGSSRAATEPFLTFRNLWRYHPELPYRVGGVLLALIYRMDELRNA